MEISIIGASGYTGIELMRILANHRNVDSVKPYSRTYAGKKVSVVNKSLVKFDKFQNFHDFDGEKTIDNIDTDVCFLCTPNGEAMRLAGALIEKGIKVIDMSADFRLPADVYEKTYKIKHTAINLIDEAVYGLPEIFREKIRNARLIANPGCYATSAILGLRGICAAKFKSRFFSDKIVVDAKSGTSGAGKKTEEGLLHSEIYNNLKPYNVSFHRHRPEIENILRKSDEFKNLKISFTPTLLPISRGIITNIHIFLKENSGIADFNEIVGHYNEIYKDEFFVRLVGNNTSLHSEISKYDDFEIQLKDVLHTNLCEISFNFDAYANRIIIISAIDNLLKGASGQAVQNMNLMCDYDEKEGLMMAGGV
ncbi:N-acetyl-gamma-glutamyl-phosphate reductase [groundwater metagenome]|uniref:N-acetyl-gamma-glutamyl-phosphate reductase n=1 Tax=groundwater metagenome TaxID=717931 RepID=A0A098E6J3_9ZZZZ